MLHFIGLFQQTLLVRSGFFDILKPFIPVPLERQRARVLMIEVLNFKS